MVSQQVVCCAIRFSPLLRSLYNHRVFFFTSLLLLTDVFMVRLGEKAENLRHLALGRLSGISDEGAKALTKVASQLM